MALAVCSLTSKLDGGPLADHGAVHVGGHTGVLSFMLVPDGVADDQSAAHHAVVVRLFVQVNLHVVFQPTATEETSIKGGQFTLVNASRRNTSPPSLSTQLAPRARDGLFTTSLC